ncbi:hypothetical protein [Fischerella sp. PCC 9605]|uniref:hypothetical protein n=1 Tax=Fischerella sp. PCC 9605 TaxID=1173024 RepID=UPI00047C3B38|nr:hypothetical protein [Fischerella sp. PCC 9605]
MNRNEAYGEFSNLLANLLEGDRTCGGAAEPALREPAQAAETGCNRKREWSHSPNCRRSGCLP